MSKILSLVEEFNACYTKRLRLVASENLSSRNVRSALGSDLHHRYLIPADADPVIWDYPSQDIPRKIAAIAQELACKIFHGQHASIAPLSGNQIALIMLTQLLKPGDQFLSVGANCGGHFTTDKIAKSHGFARIDIPYDRKTGSIDVNKTEKIAKRKGIRLAFLDASMILFPYPLQELREALGKDTIISYDASHTLGVIAGGKFQSPLEEQADFVHGSTHKSLWGPQKGLIVSTRKPDEFTAAQRVFSSIIPLFVSNAHPHHIAALGIALEEAEEFGAQYANDVIANAHLLGTEMYRRGLNVSFPEYNFTQCHQLFVIIGRKKDSINTFRRLESINIDVNAIRIPFSLPRKYGLRIGLSEITRRGITGDSTIQIANLIADTVLQTRPLEEIRKNVIEISSAHNAICYTRTPEAGIYQPTTL